MIIRAGQIMQIHQSQLVVDKVVKHVVGGMGSFAGNHVARGIDDVVDQVVLVLGDPPFQGLEGVVDCCFGGGHLPADLPEVLLSFQLGHYCVHVARIEHDLEAGLLERLEKGDGGGSPLILLPDIVAARGPLGLVNMQLRLDVGVVHVLDESGIISVTVGLIIIDVLLAVSFGVEEASVFVPSAVQGIFGVDLVVADSDGVVSVDSVGDLG